MNEKEEEITEAEWRKRLGIFGAELRSNKDAVNDSMMNLGRILSLTVGDDLSPADLYALFTISVVSLIKSYSNRVNPEIVNDPLYPELMTEDLVKLTKIVSMLRFKHAN